MAELVAFESADGVSVVVEVDDDEPGLTLAARGDGAVAQAAASLDSAMLQIRTAAQATLEALRTTPLNPDEVEVEFGIRLNVQAGAVIAKTAAEGHMQVRLLWKRADERGTSSGPNH